MGLHVRRRPDFPARLPGGCRQSGAAGAALQGNSGGAQRHGARPGRRADSDRGRPSADSRRAVGDAAHLHRVAPSGQREQTCCRPRAVARCRAAGGASRRAGESRSRRRGSAGQEHASARGRAGQESSRRRAALESGRRPIAGRAAPLMTYSGERILLSSQREGQVSRFRTWVLLGVPLAAILFQVYVPMFFPFLSFLEMPLLVVVYFAIMRRSQISGLMVGALVGLAQDSLSKNPLGMFGIVKTLVGYFAASVGVRLDVEHSLIRLLLGFFFFLFHQFLYWVMSRALLGQQMTFDLPRTAVLAALNAVVGLALFHLLDKLKERA